MSSTVETDTSFTASASPAAPFRLTIAHLLVWMAATGFALAIFPKDWLRESIPFLERRRLVEQWSIVAVAPFYGAAVTGAAIAGSRLLARRGGFPVQPGHWLLVQTGITVLAASCFVAENPNMLHFSPAALHAARRNFGAVVFLLLACQAATGIAAFQAIDHPWRWRVFFRLQLAASLAPLISFLLAITDPAPTSTAFFFWLTIGPWSVSAAVAAMAGACDLVSRSRYDLFHWTGVIAPAAILLHPTLTRWLSAIWL